MAQDCEKTFADKTMGVNYYFHGKNTLVSELWKNSVDRETLPKYQEIFDV
jgi:hypothetical protein